MSERKQRRGEKGEESPTAAAAQNAQKSTGKFNGSSSVINGADLFPFALLLARIYIFESIPFFGRARDDDFSDEMVLYFTLTTN